MSEKVKCKECENSMYWALPRRIGDTNIDYAKQCLSRAKRTLVCGWTMKTKGVEHEQYCKHYRKKDDEYMKADEEDFQRQIGNLEKKIDDYEMLSRTQAGKE